MTAPPYPAMTIAKWFVAWAEAEDEELSNLKLQKLLYYAQGHYVARHGQPLFMDAMQAWSHGPVVADVYHNFKHFGRSQIALADDDPFEWSDVDDETAEFLGEVWNTYGGYSAGRLRSMTHAETPWKANWRPDERGCGIPVRHLERYFGQLADASR